MSEADGKSRLLSLAFTDLVDSTGLKTRLGDRAAGHLIARHQEHVRRLLRESDGREVDQPGDGFFLSFETPSAATTFALGLQRVHHAEPDLPAVRIGLHLGEVTERPAPPGSSKPVLVEGLAVDLAARIQSLARPGQILMSPAAFNASRQRLAGDVAEGIAWRAHGPYRFKGIDEPLEIGEVGLEGISPLATPPDGPTAARAVARDDEVTLGWRPAIGLGIPGRQHWQLEDQLGTGAMGEVWLAAHEKTHEKRVFKFCYQAERLRSLKREVALLRLLRAQLGPRPDIAQLIDWEFEQPPYFLEEEHTEAGDLAEWARRQGGIEKVPLPTRLELVAQVADAVDASHRAGVLHKDLKPANILIIDDERAGAPRACVTDFGIGLVTHRELLSSPGVTVAGLTETLLSSSSTSGAGTRIYLAPELMEGKPATERSDVYSLGVVLYEMVAGDLSRALAPGWERDVQDELLREAIASCVDGEPERRLASAGDLATRLRRLGDERAARERGRRAARRRRRLRIGGVAALAGIVVALLVAWPLRRIAALRWAREEALPELRRLAEEEHYFDAFYLAARIREVTPNDPALLETLADISRTASVVTEPADAHVSFKPYARPDDPWRELGTAPLRGIALPRGHHRWRFEKVGFEPVEIAEQALDPLTVELPEAGTVPEGMVRVPRAVRQLLLNSFTAAEAVTLEPFLIDRYEVSNREFQEFVDQGGYERRELWRHPFVEQGRALEWRGVMTRFTDATGRPGPATWHDGAFPEGEGDFPVGGVSWYEAAAYAEFRGKSLPTLYHWVRAARDVHPTFEWPASTWESIPDGPLEPAPFGNFDGKGPAPVGSYPAMSTYGTYDMAGNAKEWVLNPSGGMRLILGGGWNEPIYQFGYLDARPPLDRSPTNGFRCMRPLAGDPNARLAGEVGPLAEIPDYDSMQPVSDEVFALIQQQAEADSTPRGPLEPRIEWTDDANPLWREQKVSFDPGYPGERMVAYLFLPRSAPPPYQPLLYWPGGYAQLSRTHQELLRHEAGVGMLDFLVGNGRAVLYPVFLGTYERGGGTWMPSEGQSSRWATDLLRTVDYAATRADLDVGRLGYVGMSWGAAMGAYLFGEQPIRASVLVSGGFWPFPMSPTSNPLNLAPRVHVPTLMLNGVWDQDFPFEETVLPMFRLLGVPDEDKRLVTFETGHWPFPRAQMEREVLAWLDRYLGPVE